MKWYKYHHHKLYIKVRLFSVRAVSDQMTKMPAYKLTDDVDDAAERIFVNEGNYTDVLRTIKDGYVVSSCISQNFYSSSSSHKLVSLAVAHSKRECCKPNCNKSP